VQSVALSACTTLVSLEPRLPMETRNRVMKVCVDMLQHNKTMLIVCLLLEEHLLIYIILTCFMSHFQATLGFFALPTEPSSIVESLITNLIILLGAILLTR